MRLFLATGRTPDVGTNTKSNRSDLEAQNLDLCTPLALFPVRTNTLYKIAPPALSLAF